MGIGLYGGLLVVRVVGLGVCFSMCLLICHCISQVCLVGVRVLASPPLSPPLRGGLQCVLRCRLLARAGTMRVRLCGFVTLAGR